MKPFQIIGDTAIPAKYPEKVMLPFAREVLSATRVHFPAGTQTIPAATEQHLRNYAISTHELGVSMAIAVNCLQEEVKRILIEAAPDLNVEVLHVPVWGAFVPALNTLLGEALRQGTPYILYQSLEVRCVPDVLTRLMDHHTNDMLVVGPVLEGHAFHGGEQPLNGRTTPWNTLALWSTRKLALTGFLNIAEGIPKQIKGQNNQCADDIKHQVTKESVSTMNEISTTMGSEGWWDTNPSLRWQPEVDEGGTPAGVEEVTVIALLQHLLGDGHARAALVQLPEELNNSVSWNTNWGGDVKRNQWHAYKMASKVARPAAQIKKLFYSGDQVCRTTSRIFCLPFKVPLSDPNPEDLSSQNKVGEDPHSELHRGSVSHFGESIRPAKHVEWICLSCYALFTANFATAFAAAFEAINEDLSIMNAIFVGLLIGGIYIPMPFSLWLTRKLTHHGSHFAGLAFFALTLLVPHTIKALWQFNGMDEHTQQTFLLASRFIEGLGSGILFQARIVLASLSTHDHHVGMQARSFLASDFGLAFGALLPYMASKLAGHQELSQTYPELFSSTVIALFSFALLVWLMIAFPRRLHQLPNCVRFPVSQGNGDAVVKVHGHNDKRMALISGTARVFVQSAAVILLALSMREAGFIGFFRQTKAVAAALSAGTCCTVLLPRADIDWKHAKIKLIGAVGIVMAIFLCTSTGLLKVETDETRAMLIAMEVVTLLVAVAIAAPQHVSRLYQLEDAERSIVILEWLKAYVGRLFAPIIAIAIHVYLGHGPLLMLLCGTTIVVALGA